MFKPSIENANVKKLVAHMLQKVDFGKYHQFLERAARYPKQDHKFLLFEYVESPSHEIIRRSELLPGTRMSIHSVIQNPDFYLNMRRLFDTDWYTRRKMDYTKPFGPEQLSDTRQVVLIVKREPEDDYSDMPPLISTTNVDVSIPEQNDMPPLIPTPQYNYIGTGLNQTIWSPFTYSYTYPSLT